MANPFKQGVWQLAHYPNDAKPCTMVFNTITDEVDSVWYADEHADHIDAACTRAEELNGPPSPTGAKDNG